VLLAYDFFDAAQRGIEPFNPTPENGAVRINRNLSRHFP
jgi:hypothetical protein